MTNTGEFIMEKNNDIFGVEWNDYSIRDGFYSTIDEAIEDGYTWDEIDPDYEFKPESNDDPETSRGKYIDIMERRDNPAPKLLYSVKDKKDNIVREKHAKHSAEYYRHCLESLKCVDSISGNFNRISAIMFTFMAMDVLLVCYFFINAIVH